MPNTDGPTKPNPVASAPQQSVAPPPPTSTIPAAPPPAPPPGADFNGAYANSPSGSTWAVTPCGPGCANITSSAVWSGQAHLADGQWRMQVHRADAVNCNAGGKAAGTTTFTIDAVTLNGTAVATTDGPACGYSTTYTGEPSALTLTKVGDHPSRGPIPSSPGSTNRSSSLYLDFESVHLIDDENSVVISDLSAHTPRRSCEVSEY
jgi:hypothetical protein